MECKSAPIEMKTSSSNDDGCFRDFELLESTRMESFIGNTLDSIFKANQDMERMSEAACQERIRHHEENARRAIEAAQRVSVCFLLDCTGSMGRWIATIKDNILIWKRRLSENYPNSKLRFSFVRYTDFDQPEATRTTFLDFTEDAEAFSAFIQGIEATGGSDAPEDVFGGLKVVVEKLTWCHDDGTKVLIHIADAPCHGNMYHESYIADDHPDGDPNVNLTDLLDYLQKMRVQYYFCYIQKQLTDKMIAEFNNILSKLCGKESYITQQDATNPESVKELVFTSFQESISRSLVCFGYANDKSVILDQCIPNWDEIESEKGIKTRPVSPNLTEDEIKLYFPSITVNVKRAARPFAMGSFRYVYHGYYTDTHTHIVLKENKKDAHYKRSLENYYTHLTAMVYARHFNQAKPGTAETIQFVSPVLLEIKEKSKWRHFSVETFIDGDYVKFNSNAGFVATSSKINDTLQAFSHYTWHKSRKRLVVCDLQGIISKSGALLTDPSIHVCNKGKDMLRYGHTNLGNRGIELFFQHHECNTVCKEMELQPYCAA